MTRLIGWPAPPPVGADPLAQARFAAWSRWRWAALAVHAARLAALTGGERPVHGELDRAVTAVTDLARATTPGRGASVCDAEVARAADGRIYVCGHLEWWHVDGRCLGCANIAAFEPDLQTAAAPPIWRVAHAFSPDGVPRRS